MPRPKSPAPAFPFPVNGQAVVRLDCLRLSLATIASCEPKYYAVPRDHWAEKIKREALRNV